MRTRSIAQPARSVRHGLFEDRERHVGPDVESGAPALALQLRLGVVEQLGELRQRFAAAELAHQLNRGPADGCIGGILQSLDLAAGNGSERDENGRQALARTRTL